MGKNKTGYAQYTFAFASDIQKLADEKHIKVDSFKTSERKSKRGSYDYLTVSFVIPRPDRDVAEKTLSSDNLDKTVHEIEDDLKKGETIL